MPFEPGCSTRTIRRDEGLVGQPGRQGMGVAGGRPSGGRPAGNDVTLGLGALFVIISLKTRPILWQAGGGNNRAPGRSGRRAGSRWADTDRPRFWLFFDENRAPDCLGAVGRSG